MIKTLKGAAIYRYKDANIRKTTQPGKLLYLTNNIIFAKYMTN